MKGIPVQELCDRLGLYVAMDEDERWYSYSSEPKKRNITWGGAPAQPLFNGVIVPDTIDWETSLFSPKMSAEGLVVDQKIMVRHTEGSNWTKRYFARVGKGDAVECFPDGATSWSSQSSASWNLWRLPTEEELGS